MIQRRSVHVAALVVLAFSVLTSCDSYPVVSKNDELSDMQDRQQQLTRQDYRNMNKLAKLLPNGAEAQAELGAPPIPDLAQVLAAPRAPKVANTKLVTLAVTDDVPLRDVLFELGRLANVDIEVGSGLDTRGINLRATDRPFNEVIERIADLGGLRYSSKGNSIRVERDTPYIKNYNLDFINMVRSSTSNYNLSTSILANGNSGNGGSGSGGNGGGGGSGGNNSSGNGNGGNGGSNIGTVGNTGSSTSITSEIESDLWASLEASVTEILNYFPQTGTDAQGSAGALNADSATPAAVTPTPTLAAAATSAASQGFVINRQAGILSVNASERQHEMIERFLTLMSRNASAQVLIEAKIVEVSLTDQFRSGVDWNKVIGSLEGVYFSPGSYVPDAPLAGSSVGALVGVDGLGLDTVVSLAEKFGTTRTLSSPRLSAINNQQAVLTFARNEVFFECTQDQAQIVSTSGGTTQTLPATTNCEANSIPIGIILNILPSINLDKQEITLSVRPTLTRKVGDAISPQTLTIGNGDTTSTIPITSPIIEVRELDSIMRVKSGGIMIIGGLMQDASTTNNNGVPGISDLPLIGSAFKSREEDYAKRELIIFIKATIVNSDGNSDKVDRAITDRFTTDPRPLFPKREDAE